MSSWNRERVRTALLVAVLLAGAAVFLVNVDQHYAIRRWLIWRYAGYWVLSSIWAGSCLAIGGVLLSRLHPQKLDHPGDVWVYAFPLGVFAFHLAIFGLGLLGLLSSVTFVLLPVLFLASGFTHLKRFWAHLLSISEVVKRRELPLLLFGLGGLALIYCQILSPEAFSYDARWYHLPIAEQYAISGAVRAFPEGWWLAAFPHLTSYVQTWSFLLPFAALFDRLELCIHLEFVVFAATAFSLPALVRRLIPAESARYSWVGMFLFPSVFLYDGNLCAGADHFAALWMVPLAMASIDLWQRWDKPAAALFAVFASGVVLTKYSAWAALPFLVTLVIGRALWLIARRQEKASLPRAQVAEALAWVVVGGLVLTTPHWLKNWIWYGNPIYPMLRDVFGARPWNPDAEATWNVWSAMIWAPRPGLLGLVDALSTMVTFSFWPNDWGVLHGKVPVFGSLFTLTTVCLPFLRARAQLWGVYLATMATLVVWFLIHHQDRYLQAFVPWMAAGTVASIILIWRTGRPAVRAALTLLVGLQLTWSADIPFIPSHNIIHTTPYTLSLALAASGYNKTPGRLRPYGPYAELGRTLPDDANVLVHDSPQQLGISARFVQDQWQGRISYGRLRSPAAIHAELQSLGITHLMWEPGFSNGWNSLASDLAFLNFSENYGVGARGFGRLHLARMPESAPESFNDRVAVFACGSPIANGWYRLKRLNVAPGHGARREKGRPPQLAAAIAEAGFLVVDPRCAPALPADLDATFHYPASRKELRLYTRRLAPQIQ